MPECVGNYSILTVSGNVEGADTLAGAAILNFPNIYVQQRPTLNASHYSVHNSRFLRRVSPVVHKRFLSTLSICSPNQYWPMLLVSSAFASERVQLQNCLENALAELEN